MQACGCLRVEGARVDTVCVKPASQRKVWIPPAYGTRPKLVCASEPQMTETVVPAVWGTKTREVEVCPEREECYRRICCPPEASRRARSGPSATPRWSPPRVTRDGGLPGVRLPGAPLRPLHPGEVRDRRGAVRGRRPAGARRCASRRCSSSAARKAACSPATGSGAANTDLRGPGRLPAALRSPARRPALRPCPPPAPLPPPALQVEMDDSGPSGEAAGIFSKGTWSATT